MYIVKQNLHDFNEIKDIEYDTSIVTAIIPVYSTKSNTLNECLNEILNQTYNPLEILIINNGISDIESQINIDLSQIKIINLDKNYGASYARNEGAFHSNGKYLWFIDSDIIQIDKDCVKNMVEILDNNSRIGAIGGISWDNSIKKETLHIGQCIDPYYSDNPQKYKLYDDDYVNTGCMMTLRNIFIFAEGFTEYIEYLHDDNDFGFKIKAMNLRCVGDYRVIGKHIPKDNQVLNFSHKKMGVKNTILYLFINYKIISLIKFLYYKFFKYESPEEKAKEDLQKISIPAESNNKVKDLFVNLITYLSVFLFMFPRVFTVFAYKRERQSLLTKLRRFKNEVN